MRRQGPLRPLETTWEDWLLGGGAAACFADPSLPLEVEIGPGDDDYLLAQAAADPRTNWLGIEYSRKRVRRYVRRVSDRLGTPGNLRLVWRPAADLVRPFLVPARVRAFHIHFPDPWPKAHHARYRLMAPAFLADLAAALVPDGTIHIATDAEDYAAEMATAFADVPGLAAAHPAPGFVRIGPGARTTPFEARWREAGREILALAYRRR